MLEPGDAVDVWVVDRALGHGGMGSVYRCHNRNAPRILAAVKVLELPIRRHPETTTRFVREAEILFGLDHPNIVKVRNIRTEHDPPYLEMEFVEGESLEDTLQRGPLPDERARDVILQCARAVHYLHRRGVRHRDIKPANFLLRRDGRVKLVDFGLAMEQDVSRITQAGMAFGTVSYAPPEWANPERLDPVHWDAYALGVVMYEILTGKVAFPVSGQGTARQQAMQVVLAKQGHDPLDPGDSFDDDLRELVGALTQSDPDRRLADLGEALRRLGETVPRRSSLVSEEDDQPSVITTVPTPGVPMPRQRAPETWQHPPSEAPSTPPSSSRAPLLAGAALTAVSGALLLAAIVLVIGAAWMMTGTHAEATVVVSGITKDVPHQIQVAGRRPDRSTELSHHFSDLPVGEVEVTWVAGEDCTVDACGSGDCAASCGFGTTRIEVDSSGRADPVAIPYPDPRSVRIELPDLPKDMPVALSVDGSLTSPTAGSSQRTPNLLPGRHQLRLLLGDCPSNAEPCEGVDCPEGCVVAEEELMVPWSGVPQPPSWPDDLLSRLAAPDVPAPEPKDPAPTPKQPIPTPPPAPVPAPRPTSSGSLVLQRDFSAWLQTDAGQAYEPGGIRDHGNGHLAGWSGTTPPSPGKPVEGVHFLAARAYCSTRGGLPGVDDAPTEVSGHEWRKGSDGSAWVRIPGGKTDAAGRGTGAYVAVATFRCLR